MEAVPRAQPGGHRRRSGSASSARCCRWPSTSTTCRCSAAATLLGRVPRGRRAKAGDDVRVAGVKVGKVTAVDLDGGHVRVDFRVDHGTGWARKTGATMRIKTVLGQKYLALEPAGRAADEGDPAGAHRAAYDVIDAFSGLARTTEEIDTEQFAKALDTIADTFKDTPGRGQGRRRRACPGCPRRSPPATTSSASCWTTPRASPASWPSATRSCRSCSPTATCCWRRCGAARRTSTRCWSAPSTLADQLTGLVRENRRSIRPALAEPARTCSDAASEPGQPGPRASSCSRRSCGSSPTRSATAAGSTPTSEPRAGPGGPGERRMSRRPQRRRGSWRPACWWWPARVVLWPRRRKPARCAPSSSAPSGSTRAPTCGSSA